MHTSEYETHLTSILKDIPQIMEILRIVRETHLPNWYVGAGVIRNAVWDTFHGKTEPTLIRDIDCIYYSETDVDEKPIKKYLEKALPNVEWDIKNSRHIHEWYKSKGIDRPQLISTEDDIRQWPEVVTCIGVRLLDDDTFHIFAPYGLEDLLEMIWRPNLHETYRSREYALQIFNERLSAKKVRERWPQVRVELDRVGV